MKKCPICGSTAQVKRDTASIDLDDTNNPHITIGYYCGCGCYFETEYQFGDDDKLEQIWEGITYRE